MKINIDYREYSIETQKHGLIKFMPLSAFREESISSRVKNPRNESPGRLADELARFSIIEFEGHNIKNDEYGKVKLFLEQLNLSLSKEEQANFAQQFIENNNLLLKTEQEKREPIWPNDVLLKLKELWCLHEEQKIKYIQKISGLKGLSEFSGIAAIIKQQRDVFERIKELNIPDIKSSVESYLDTEKINRSIMEGQRQAILHAAEKDRAIIETPIMIRKLMELQASIFQANNELIRVSNQYLEEQVEISKKDSREASTLSKIAIIIASLTLAFSIVIGVLQLRDGNESKKVFTNIMNSMSQNTKIMNDNAVIMKEYNEIIRLDVQQNRDLSSKIINYMKYLEQSYPKKEIEKK